MPSDSSPFSFARYVSTGTAGPYAINFDYLSSEHLSVLIDGEIQSSSTYTLDTNTDNVTFNSSVPNGSVVLIQRTTPKGKTGFQNDVADFSDGSILTAADLDQATLGLLFVAQEADDGGTTNALNKDKTDLKWDAKEQAIKNLATPTSGLEAATKDYVDAIASFGAPSSLQLYSFTTDGSTTYTMDPEPGSSDPRTFIVDVGGVLQRPTTDFTISNNVLTFGSAPDSGQTLTVRNIGLTRDTLAQPVRADTNSDVSLQIKRRTSQTGDLQQWQLADGTAASKVDKDGHATFANLTSSGTTELTGNVSVNTDKFNVTAASGNTTIAGTLGVTDATTLSAATQINATLTATGLATLSGGVAAATGNITTTSGNITSTSGHLYVPGSVVQVQCYQTIQYGEQTQTQNVGMAIIVDDGSGGNEDVAVSLTPKSTNSKIMVDVNWFGEALQDHMFYLRRTNGDGSFTDLKGQTGGQANPKAGLSNSARSSEDASTPNHCTIKFFDDGSAFTKWSAAGLGAITYTLYYIADNNSTVTTNRERTLSDNDNRERGYTIMIATEIAG
ncbi:MAG: putative tail fiber protein [Prokaryotic dsDNA virus sp.]|nr:MAG: putative tail fiber protein [Prokaryotic dsDNA virus sp.]